MTKGIVDRDDRTKRRRVRARSYVNAINIEGHRWSARQAKRKRVTFMSVPFGIRKVRAPLVRYA